MLGSVSRLGRQRCKRGGLALADDLHEDFVLLDHAQLVARAFLDRAGAVLEVAHFGIELGVAGDQLRILLVRHVHLRDTGRGPEQFQVRVGQGEVEYGRIVAQLSRCHYERALSADVRDVPDAAFPMAPEVRKLKYLLESMV